MNIQQGARSSVNLIEVDDVLCVEKHYNHRKDPPVVKLRKERAFYSLYNGLDIIPKLVSWKEPDTIVITYCEGDRLIDLIKGEKEGLDIEAISRDYGEKVVSFFDWPMPQTPAEVEEARTTIEFVIEKVHAAIREDRRYQIAEIEESVEGLVQLLDVDEWWALPMMCKYDGSAANMLVKDNRIACII